MVKTDITVDEIIADMLDSIGDRSEPCKADGWVSFTELLDSARGFTENQMRDKAGQKVKAGEWDGLKWGRLMYYRVKK